jgi:FkbM family methyltransferase
VQDNFKKVVSNINKYNCHNVQPTNLALSDKRGTAEFYVSSGHPDHLPRTDEWNYGNKSSSLLEPDKTKKIYPWISFDKRSQVATDTLYNFCTENNIQGIDFAHIDVQGAELMVLNGASSLINQIKSIWIEVEAISLYRKQPLRKEVESFMKKNGFKKIKDTIEEVYGEQLFVNTRFF